MRKMAEPAAHRDEPHGSTIDADEVAKFAAMAEEWWDPRGPFAPLHVFNPVRLGFIRDAACAQFGRADEARRPLEGLRLLDVGCGGGLVSEPMARLGAQVTGVDASETNVKAAQAHAVERRLDIDYRACAVEDLLAAGEAPFDIVLALEIVEHVADVDEFLSACAELVAPGGLLVLATLNRTPKAFALAVVGAEYVLGWLPRGSHDWSKFVKPSEAAAALNKAGLNADAPVGVSFNPILGRWRLSEDASVNYMLAARREAEKA
jgi:2-polyprenyl-6-hydroxyphenyl methylase/3-demethylubiquinone-9 3-methyltransferase